MPEPTLEADGVPCFNSMLRLIDRCGRNPRSCPACGSSVLATLLPWDFPFIEAVRRAQDQCRAAYQRKHSPPGPTPAWRCLDCVEEIPIDPTRED